MSHHGRGLGLIAMQERAQAQGGAFAIESPRSGGTRVVVTMQAAAGSPPAEAEARAV
jgi:signal transduction histidine kinase